MSNLGKKRLILWKHQRGKCKYCKQHVDFKASTVDHVIPKSKGGTNALDNLVMSCWRCNNEKDSRIFVVEEGIPRNFRRVFGVKLALYYKDGQFDSTKFRTEVIKDSCYYGLRARFGLEAFELYYKITKEDLCPKL